MRDLTELISMWKSQKTFNSNFVNFDNLTLEKKQEYTKEYVLHLLSEANSLLETINWKMHHKKDVEVSRSDLVFETIDVWKYLLSIILIWDITPEEFLEAYYEKSQLVEQRYVQEFSDRSGKDIVICDIDGVLSNYPHDFLEFVKNQLSTDSESLVKFSSDDVDQIDLYQYLSGVVSQEFLGECKHLYRSTGMSRRESVIDGAREFLVKLKEEGYYVVLLTSRPFDKYRSLFVDTYVWLESNRIPFDMILSDSKKRGKVVKFLKTSNVKFVVDDDPRIVSGLESVNDLSKIYLINRPYNESYLWSSDRVVRVSNFKEILEKEGID